MKKDEFEKSKKELEKFQKQNQKIMAISVERTRMSKANSLEYKSGITLFLSALAYFILIFTSMALGTGFIASIFPGFTYPVALIGSSLAIGTLGQTLVAKKFKTNERLKAFSTAKNESEKLEEEVHYQIEFEKANNRNEAINETIKVLNANQTMLSKISSRYELNDKIAPQTKEEAEKKVEELSTMIKEEFDKLDVLTTQDVLHNRFWKIRQKIQRRTELIIHSMVGGLFSMIFIGFIPTFALQELMSNSSILTTLAVQFTPFIAGTIGCSLYMLKRNKNYKKVFNKFNSKLGKNSLEENLDEKFESAIEEKQGIEKLIESQIRDISFAEVQLQENKRYLEAYITEEEKKKDILFKDVSKVHINEEPKKDILEHPEKYSDWDIRTRMGKFYTDEEREKYIEESLTKSLPENDEKGPALVKKNK